jgi:ABC-type lipoprotein export system ATPase subunit
MVTHQEEAAQMADRVIRIEDGKVCRPDGGLSREQNEGQRRMGSGKEQAL